MDASVAAQLADRRREVEASTVNAVSKYVTNKIRAAATLGERDTLITVPAFVIGTPQYDLADMIVEIMSVLTFCNYYVMSVGDGRVYVSWRRSDRRLKQHD
jgi:hypothetical protein